MMRLASPELCRHTPSIHARVVRGDLYSPMLKLAIITTDVGGDGQSSPEQSIAEHVLEGTGKGCQNHGVQHHAIMFKVSLRQCMRSCQNETTKFCIVPSSTHCSVSASSFDTSYRQCSPGYMTFNIAAASTSAPLKLLWS